MLAVELQGRPISLERNAQPVFAETERAERAVFRQMVDAQLVCEALRRRTAHIPMQRRARLLTRHEYTIEEQQGGPLATLRPPFVHVVSVLPLQRRQLQAARQLDLRLAE